ncbi:hypothetical protein EYF80_039847 [Liparis tanakae]|uniref:Uncharacterized protein n=1 Tax=Liparis tanakae TaxID=230148 RepID=A0A4Z2G8V5_9TELE|nr:hypothetical protein EYF80_039847 [Liparis tanakae]
MSPWKNTTCRLRPSSSSSSGPAAARWSASGRSSSRSFTRRGSYPGTESSFWSLCRGLPARALRLADALSPGASGDDVAEVMLLWATAARGAASTLKKSGIYYGVFLPNSHVIRSLRGYGLTAAETSGVLGPRREVDESAVKHCNTSTQVVEVVVLPLALHGVTMGFSSCSPPETEARIFRTT